MTRRLQLVASQVSVAGAWQSLSEIEELVRCSYDLVIALLPDGKAMPTPQDASEAGVKLLQHLRAIRCEAEELRSHVMAAPENGAER